MEATDDASTSIVDNILSSSNVATGVSPFKHGFIVFTTLESNIQTTQMEIKNPKEMEILLRQRLDQLTDHLIQKQARVEALSSEKAMLLFRIEVNFRISIQSKKMMPKITVNCH
ncbi:putative golgin candidate 2 [Forsythia ovata]|uniref:Golgin candidate 2 n=1 Tax=Forsythia ovata TaxID=205694 RepID=A0ABD1NYJ6_9LAMI